MIHDLDYLLARAVRRGLLINLIAPAVIVAVAFALHESGTVQTIPELEYGQSMLFYVLVAVAIGELVAAFVLRRRLFSSERVRPFRHNPALVEAWLMRSSTIVFALGASPIAYGAILYLLSGDVRQLVLFGIISLLAYRLFRPTKDLLEAVLDGPPAT